MPEVADAPAPPAEPETRRRRSRRRERLATLSDRGRRLLVWAWVLVVVLYFTWEAAGYRGIYAVLAEWQFDRFGQDLPTFTFGLLTTLFAWPALVLVRRRARDDRRPRDAAEQAVRDMARAIDAARDYLNWLWGFAAVLGGIAVAAMLYTTTLPRLEGPVREVSVDSADPPEGPVRLSGQFGYGRIASFSRGILFVRRSELFAPILSAGSPRNDIRFFVQFDPYERPQIQAQTGLSRRRGILARNDMPGALVRLYRYLGYLPAERYYVLYASTRSIRWPFYVFALQFAIGAAIFGGAALVQRRHVGRLLRRPVDLEAARAPGPAGSSH